MDGCSEIYIDRPRTQNSLKMTTEDTSSRSKMVVLNRPHALNAFNTTMVTQLLRLYRSWAEDSNVGFVVLKGNGRAFCAGGDVVSAYHMINEGKMDDCKEFFKRSYTLIYLIGSYYKPQVAILNGITMGGGSGISVLGTFRLATEKTVFAIPEILIGFHPDGAASYYLGRLPGHLGEYLALTAEKLNGPEMVACGLATHYLHSTRVPLIEEKLVHLETNAPAKIANLLDDYAERTQLHDQSILNRMAIINECFGCDTIEDIFDALKARASGADYEWCHATLNKIKGFSPLSLKVSLKSIREGRFQTLEQCIEREYWMTLQAIHGNISRDFIEGVRSRLVDKTSAPKWNPSCLSQVSQDMVDEYFSPCSQTEPPLELPTPTKYESCLRLSSGRL